MHRNILYKLLYLTVSGDDDSGTDENCDLPLLSSPTPPSSGFAMAKKMTIGVVSEEPGIQEGTSKSGTNDPVHDSDDKLGSNQGLLFSYKMPTTDTLAELRRRKKVQELIELGFTLD